MDGIRRSLPKFEAYLRGIETTSLAVLSNLTKGFEAYLRGIETFVLEVKRPGEKPFEAYLRGIETVHHGSLLS